MSSSSSSTQGFSITSLPGAAQLRIFQLFCDGCGPDTPGTCWLAPVCKQWRGLARGVKGLRVLFQGRQEEPMGEQQQQHVDSFCSWLRCHAPQIKVLAITSEVACHVLAALSEAAVAAAAAGGPLQLQRLVVSGARDLLQPQVCHGTLQPLWAALPHLHHLHLCLVAPRDLPTGSFEEATVAALAPLQHSTSLTSLVLDGPSTGEYDAQLDAVYTQLLANLPCRLRSLTWYLRELDTPGVLSFGHLSALTYLKLDGYQELFSPYMQQGPFPDGTFTGLQQLRKLELDSIPVSDELLLQHKEQLVGFTPAAGGVEVPAVLDQLKQLQVFSMGPPSEPVALLWQQLQQLQEIGLVLPYQPNPEEGEEARPGVLQHCSKLPKLRRLALNLSPSQPVPLELSALTQLTQLVVGCAAIRLSKQTSGPSWAQAVAGLANLEVLHLLAEFAACGAPWLTRLTRLVVLEVNCSSSVSCGAFDMNAVVVNNSDMAAVATHIGPLLAPPEGSSTSTATDSSSRRLEVRTQDKQVLVVCVSQLKRHEAEDLQQALAAAVPVLPPNKHLFRGSWKQLQQCGVELWPAPVAARLRQLVPE
jgi:hypothetical protein